MRDSLISDSFFWSFFHSDPPGASYGLPPGCQTFPQLKVVRKTRWGSRLPSAASLGRAKSLATLRTVIASNAKEPDT
jgi:hypothetical protein